LSLSYKGAYGDTSAGATLLVQVKEIAQSAKFNDTSVYRISHPVFATIGGTLGSKTIAFSQFKDSIRIVRKIGDTTKTANELRIRIDPSLIQRFKSYDTAGAYKNDSLFHAAFSGFKIEATGTTKAIAYFGLSDQTKTKLTFYYRTSRNGVKDTSTADFYHYASGSRANTIRRDPSGDFATFLNNSTPRDEKIFIQGGSPGSVATISIPALSTLSNRVIHRAELIISKIPSASEALYPAPPVVFLDQINLFDVGSSIIDDISSTSADGTTQSTSVFGGAFRSDSTYRFNLTRHVQAIVTKKEPNNNLRLYAPLYTFIKALPENTSATRVVSVLPQIAYGRIVLGGGNYPDQAKRLKLRIIYSKIQ
ncbi:MAG: hypothetical protein JWP88_1965, partial [Flaviaesturariibacter sp.]|nr:hypothetical protein [Flaviaesturariibacter sp.]